MPALAFFAALAAVFGGATALERARIRRRSTTRASEAARQAAAARGRGARQRHAVSRSVFGMEAAMGQPFAPAGSIAGAPPINFQITLPGHPAYGDPITGATDGYNPPATPAPPQATELPLPVSYIPEPVYAPPVYDPEPAPAPFIELTSPAAQESIPMVSSGQTTDGFTYSEDASGQVYFNGWPLQAGYDVVGGQIVAAPSSGAQPSPPPASSPAPAGHRERQSTDLLAAR